MIQLEVEDRHGLTSLPLPPDSIPEFLNFYANSIIIWVNPAQDPSRLALRDCLRSRSRLGHLHGGALSLRLPLPFWQSLFALFGRRHNAL